MGLDHGTVRRIVSEAAILTGPEREVFIKDACGTDAGLLAEVREILALALANDGFLQPPKPETLLTYLDTLGLPCAGDDLGGFRIIRTIASGGMGSVFEARQTEPSRAVALKVLRRGFGDEEARKRFRREIEVLARLRHPGIAQIYASGVVNAGSPGEIPWYAMELVEKASTLVRYAHDKGLTTHGSVHLIAQVCDAVHHGHQRGVIHRDLKPENVLVDSSGRVKVIDFGVARALEEETGLGSLSTRYGDVLGTPSAMSPEQLSGNPDAVDTRTDVWALGVMLYQLLTGSLPFPVEGRPLAAIARAIAEAEPVKPRQLRPVLDADLEKVTLKALAKDPSQRYSSVAALRDDLDAWLEGRAVSAQSPSLAYQIRVLARRHRPAVFAAAAVVATSIAAAAVSLHFAFEARRSERLALTRFDDVKSIGRSLIFEIHDAIAPLSGATNARRVVVSTALTYLDKLFVDADGDAELLREVGEGYLRLGTLLAAPVGSSLGDVKGGRDALEKSLAAADAWIAVSEVDVRAPALRARALSTLGNVEVSNGNVDVGLTLLERGDGEIHRLTLAHPSNRELRRLEGALRSLYANGLLRSGNSQQALTRYRQSAELARALCTEDPKDPVTARDLAITLVKIGNVELEHGRVREAEVALTEAVNRNEERVAASPASREARDDLSNSLERLGDALKAGGKLDRALVLLERSVSLRRETVSSDSGDAGARQSLSIALERLGDAFDTRKDFVKALEFHSEALALSRKDLDRNPRSWSAQHAVAIGETYVGACLRKLGRVDEAIMSLDKAIDLGDAMLAVNPKSADARRTLVGALSNCGQVFLDAKKPADALTRFARMDAILTQASVAEPSHAWTQRMRLVSLSHTIMACRAIGEDESLSTASRRARLEQALAAGELADAEYLRLEKLGFLLTGDSEAREAVRQDIEACSGSLAALGSAQ